MSFIGDALTIEGLSLANRPKRNLLRSFEGFDLLVSSTKCCGAHELPDSDLSGSVVKNVTESEQCELIAL